MATRLYPATLAVSKQLLPVYDKPMLYYPLSVLMSAGIREILIISTPPAFASCLGMAVNGGLMFSYAEPFLTGEAGLFDPGCNLFYGAELPMQLRPAMTDDQGARVLAYRVDDSARYGVLTLDEQGKALAITEKSANPASHLCGDRPLFLCWRTGRRYRGFTVAHWQRRRCIGSSSYWRGKSACVTTMAKWEKS